LGKPIRFDLDHRGIRDIALVGSGYFFIAGDYKAAGVVSQLHHWSGGPDRPSKLLDFSGFNAEAIVAYPDTGEAELQVLSDDGQKPPLPVKSRKFRSVQVNF